jgi:thioredoxin-related protein
LRILNYADGSIRLRDDVVVEIKSVEAARAPVAATESAAPANVSQSTDVAASAAEWTTDYRSALARAQSDRRNVFLFFTGSDWCGWCKRLDREILSTEDFKSYAAKELILVKLDFPRHLEQSEELKNQNRALAEEYQITGYPTVVVLDPTGKKVKILGYQEGGPGPFIDALRSVEP